MKRRRRPDTIVPKQGRAFADFHEWVLSLPWTVERPYSLETPGVRCFGIDCPPLGRRRMWMLTGLQRTADPTGLGLAVIVPQTAAAEVESLGWGCTVAAMPAGQALATVDSAHVSLETVEALVLTAYSCAMS